MTDELLEDEVDPSLEEEEDGLGADVDDDDDDEEVTGDDAL